MAEPPSTNASGAPAPIAKSEGKKDTHKKILKATLQTCLGCQLKKHPQIKQFIDLDLPEFINITLGPKPKQIPQALFESKSGHLLETVQLAGKSRSECNQLFFNKGFTKKTHVEMPKSKPKP